MKIFLKALAIILLVNLSFGALYGSWIFISDPSGSKFNMTVELLRNTPFEDYLIPGIILLIANGLLPIFIIISIIRRIKNYNWFLLLQGCLLIGWLTVELVLNKNFFVPVLHYACYVTGLLFLLIGYILMRLETKDSSIVNKIELNFDK